MKSWLDWLRSCLESMCIRIAFLMCKSRLVVQRCRHAALQVCVCPGYHGNRFRHRRPAADLNRRSQENQIRFGNFCKKKWLTVHCSTGLLQSHIIIHLLFKFRGSSSHNWHVGLKRSLRCLTSHFTQLILGQTHICTQLLKCDSLSSTHHYFMTMAVPNYNPTGDSTRDALTGPTLLHVTVLLFTGCWISCSALVSWVSGDSPPQLLWLSSLHP